MARSRSNADPETIRAFGIDAARALADDKSTDIVLLDVRGLSQICDFVLIGSGTSERQMKSVAQTIEDLGKERGSPPYRSSRDSSNAWIVVDFVELVVHLFEPEHRVYYDLESLWGEGRRVEWERAPEDRPPVPRGGGGA